MGLSSESVIGVLGEDVREDRESEEEDDELDLDFCDRDADLDVDVVRAWRTFFTADDDLDFLGFTYRIHTMHDINGIFHGAMHVHLSSHRSHR